MTFPGRAGEPANPGMRFGAIGAVFGFLGVLAGAFGAHAVRASMTTALMSAFETAARYQLIHAVALLVVALALERSASRPIAAAGVLFSVGVVLFSGSLYALSLSGQTGWGMVTPFGGLCFLTGWLCLAVGFARPGRRAA